MVRDSVPNPFEDTTRMAPAPGAVQEGGQIVAYLVVLAGSNVGEMHRVENEKTVMGRGDKVDVRLVDEGISREHAQVAVEGPVMVVKHLASTTGAIFTAAP